MTTIPTLPLLEIAVRTDPGRDPDKQVNEDASTHVETKHGLLAVVCDGMGGHAGGKEASELAIRTIVEVVEAAPMATPAGVALKRAIEEANARVWAMPTAEAGYRPGSTVVALLIHADGAEVAHVGDSRVYLVHAGAIAQVTRDHSMVQEMVDRKIIRAEDAAKHPDANKILRALGIAKEVEVDLRAEPVAYVTGDTFVLCSDGLSDLVEPPEILEIAGGNPPAQAAPQLVDLANARGGHDNITAMVVRAKTSATTRAPGAIQKTIPLTAHAPMPPAGDGPTGTYVSAPFQPPTPPPPPMPSGPSVSAPPSSVPAPAPRSAMLGVGIALAVAALVILGAVVFVTQRPQHHHARLVDDDRVHDAAPANAADDDDAAPIVPAPPLNAPTTEPTTRKWSHEGGTSDPCGAVRRAHARDASGPWVEALAEKCRASGGQP